MDFESLHQILRQLYEDMLPKCSEMAGVAKGVAGLGALFFVAYRVWSSLARAEPIDIYPLLRPIAVGFCILFFPLVINLLNGVLSPIVKGTHQIMESQTLDMKLLAQQKDRLEYEAMKRNPETAYLVDDAEFDSKLSKLGIFNVGAKAGMHVERLMYNTKKDLQQMVRNLLELFFHGAALVIDVVRTFFLIVLVILGPIAFSISVWDGFHSSLTQWLMRYISVYLWLPVSDLFSTILARIQTLMLDNDIQRMQSDPDFSLDSSDGVYILFMIIGILGYFTIPTVASWIVQTGGGGAVSRVINTAAMKGGAAAGGFAGAAAGNLFGHAKNLGGKLIKRLRNK